MKSLAHHLLEEQIKLLVAKYWKQAERFYPEQLAGKQINNILFTTRPTSKAGIASWIRKLGVTTYSVSFNLGFASSEGIEAFEHTVAHEVAHIITWICFPRAKQAHGPEFKFVMEYVFGLSGATYHNYSVQQAKAACKGLKLSATNLTEEEI